MRGVEIIGASLCFWAAAFWFLRWLPLSLDTVFYACSIGGVAAHALWPRRASHPRRARLPVGALLTLAVIVWLRLLPMNANPAPAGADMSMHTYLVEMIVQANGLPESYRPILPLGSFASFPVGFHVPAALVSLTTGIPSYRAAFLVTCLTHAFLTLSLFVLLRVHTAVVPAAIVAFAATFVPHAPQNYVGWGGNPTALAIAFSALLGSALLRLPRWRTADAALAGLFLAGVALTHTIVLVQAFYLMGVPLLVWLALRGPRGASQLWGLLVFGGSFVLLSLPYLASLDPDALTPETRAWIQNWVSDTDHVWRSRAASAPFTIPTYVLYVLGDRSAVFLPVLAFGVAALRRRDPMALALQAAFFVVAFLLILNTHFWWLPLSPLVYPERVAAMLILPAALLTAVGLEALFGFVGAGRRAATAIAVALALFLGAGSYRAWYLQVSSDRTAIRNADLRALDWLDRHAAPDDVIVTQYGDAGIWIPGLLFRPVTEAHVNVLHLATVAMPTTGRFLYVGARCVHTCPWTLETPPDPTLWREVHADGAARIYERSGGEGVSP